MLLILQIWLDSQNVEKIPEENGCDWTLKHRSISYIDVFSLLPSLRTENICSLHHRKISFADYFPYGLRDKEYQEVYFLQSLASKKLYADMVVLSS